MKHSDNKYNRYKLNNTYEELNMMMFLFGFILGGFSLICLALCQVQGDSNSTEKIYFAISTDVEGVKLYLDKNGVYSSFSITDTLLEPTISALNGKYKDVTKGAMEDDLVIEKIGVDIRFIQSFN